MGFGLVLAGFIILFNPVIIVVDVIPDVIGFFLITAGLTKLSYFIEGVEKARSMFFKLALVEVAKMASIFFFVGKMDNGSTELLLAFLFSIGEAAMFVPAVIWLFDGLSFSGLKFKGEVLSAESRIGRSEKNSLVKTRNYVIFFYIFRSIATLIPELTELQMYDHIGEVHSYSRPLTYYKENLYKFLSAVVIILGVIYIVKITRFFVDMMKDNEYRDGFMTVYEKALTDSPSFFLSRRMMTALVLFILASLSTYTLLFDDVDIMIGAISAIFFAASALTMRKYVPKAIAVVPLAAARAAASIWSFIIQVRYFDGYAVEAIDFSEKARALYNRLLLATTADKILASAVLIVYVSVLVGGIREHLKVCGITEESAQFSKKRSDREKFTMLRGKLIATAVLGVLYFVSCALYRYLVIDIPVFIVVFVILSIIFIAYAAYTVVTINGSIYSKESIS